MARRFRSKYESEIHLGFVAIASLLVFLNFVSNYVLHQARSTQRDDTQARLHRAAVVISREMEIRYPATLDQTQVGALRDRQDLSDLTFLPVKPAEDTKAGKRDWFRAVTLKYPPGLYPDLAEKLYRAELGQITRGNGSEYYYLYPIPGSAGGGLLMLTMDCPDLAYLDDSRDTLVLVLIGAVVLVAAVYVLLSRFMFRPFRRIREQAEQAGRAVTADLDETEAVVQEYERVIRELTVTQKELLRLNEEIQRRADILELINRSLTETSRLGVITLDPQGKIVAVNETAERLLDLPSDDCAGHSFGETLGRFEALMHDIERALADDRFRGYHEYLAPDGRSTSQTLGVTIVDIRNPGEGLTGLLLMVSDQSELSRLRRELEDQRRLAALGEMAGGLAHQIRNSLGAISGYATLIKRRLKLNDLVTDAADTLLDETRTAHELISRFLSFARPFEFKPEPTDLAALVAECLAPVRVRQDLHGVEFRELLNAGMFALVDPILLKQAITNMLDNAVNAYGETAGLVEVSLRESGDRAMIEIRDFGCGIRPDALDKVFTPFYSSRPSGTGLGLPLAAKIVALHSGTIEVSSEPDHGTTFRICLPLNVVAGRRLATEVTTPV
ncbi:MAG: ATP-binding protein [Candidatus Zixiibacteriota bacterium]